MASDRIRALIGSSTIGWVCGGFAFVSAGFLAERYPDDLLDAVVIACLPAIVVGFVSVSIGERVARWVKGRKLGRVAIEIERVVRASYLPFLLACAIWSRPMAIIAAAATFGALFALKNAAISERDWLIGLGDTRTRDL